MSVISPSKLGENFDSEFQARLNDCKTPEEIKTLMHDHELAAGLVRLDWNPATEFRIEVPESPQPRTFTKTVVVDGTSLVISGASEAELSQNETALYRKLFAQPAAPAPQPTPARDANTGRFVEQERQAEVSTMSAEEKAALQLQFQLGQIDVATYIEKSGAVSDYLEKQGVPLNALQETIQEKQTQKFTQSWADATNTFISRHPEWPGTDLNRQILGKYIIENGLIDGDPLEAMETAYAHAKENSMLVENPETAARARQAEWQQQLAEAKTPEELRDTLGYRGQGSGFWDGR